jgi:hypothetical protein
MQKTPRRRREKTSPLILNDDDGATTTTTTLPNEKRGSFERLILFKRTRTRLDIKKSADERETKEGRERELRAAGVSAFAFFFLSSGRCVRQHAYKKKQHNQTETKHFSRAK